MTPEERLSLAKEAIRGLPDQETLRWNRNSWDYALFEKRYRVGVSLEERPLDPNVHGVAVRDGDDVESLRARLEGILMEAGWGKSPRSQPPDKRARNRRIQEDEA